MTWPRVSVHSKLMLVTMGTCVAGLLLVGGIIIASELGLAQYELERQLTSVADLIAAGNTATVKFGDKRAAQETLQALQAYPDVDAARIDAVDEQGLASFARATSRIPTGPANDTTVNIGPSMVVSRPISLDGRTIGHVLLQGSLERAYARVRQYASILAIVIVVSLIGAYLLSSALTRVISGQIHRLAQTAAHVSSASNYQLRAVRESDDELGLLVDRFNDMLAQIERRDQALVDAHDKLDQRVRERTATLEQEIAQRRRTENELTVAKGAAEQANRAKSAFLANMTHELRTPLNAIIGYSELLAEEAGERGFGESLADLTKITSSGRHLLDLINDVLDLSKIEAGRMDVSLATIDLAAVVRAVTATGESLAAARGNRLIVGDLGQAGTICADRIKLQQILLNLVSNACKFTSGGEVRIDVRREQSAAGEWASLVVSDTGIGMTDEQLARLFSHFTQVHTSSQYGGTGLGLAISRRLSRMMGGDISVASTHGAGSTFTVRLPAAPATAPDLAGTTSSTAA